MVVLSDKPKEGHMENPQESRMDVYRRTLAEESAARAARLIRQDEYRSQLREQRAQKLEAARIEAKKAAAEARRPITSCDHYGCEPGACGIDDIQPVAMIDQWADAEARLIKARQIRARLRAERARKLAK